MARLKAKPRSANPKRQFGLTKPNPHLIPPCAILEESIAMALGAHKYGAYNWTDEPIDASTYYSALIRHAMDWFTGENYDPQSRVLHLAHVRACCGILIDAILSGTLIDDRPATAPTARQRSRLTRALAKIAKIKV